LRCIVKYAGKSPSVDIFRGSLRVKAGKHLKLLLNPSMIERTSRFFTEVTIWTELKNNGNNHYNKEGKDIKASALYALQLVLLVRVIP
jgi:hypothetical protein